ncbi:MAG: UDP-N-acetylmuramoyl-L-alanine--D-glutamate ligase [Coriobacteriales bacterium]
MSNVLVLGLGKAGAAAARHALAAGDAVTVYAGPSTDASQQAAQPLLSAGARVVFDTEEVEGRYELCIASPGISCNSAFYKSAQAASAELVGECEYAFRLSPHDWLAVTGTNGKTTTTSLLAHLLNAAGKLAYPCGNIGDTCTQSVEHRREGEALVAEMSSYGLASTSRFAPRVAALLNITPDHLSWHGSLEAYAQAKLKVFDNMGPGCTAVVCAEVPGSEQLVDSLRAKGVTAVCAGVQQEGDCAFERADGMLCVSLGGQLSELCRADELQIKGPHNVMNALAAAACALGYGCSAQGVAQGLRTFAPLEHRIEPCGTVGGVGYYNDSKATNVDAVLVALRAFPGQPIVLLLGGRDKGTDLAPLVQACKGPVRLAVVYGEAAERFYGAFEGSGIELAREPGMREAFAHAAQAARPGEVVLLSPACASFDEFSSFNHRGEVFKGLVAALEG